MWHMLLGYCFYLHLHSELCDYGTGTYEHAILPNGHCNYVEHSEYNTLSKVIYTLLLVIYWYTS